MMKGLVLFDYDGTLVDEREGILSPTAMTKHAVEELQKRDMLCVLATGRALSYIPKGAKDLYLDGYVTSNGAYITVHGKVLFQNVFEDKELQALLLAFNANNINFILENAQYCYVKDLLDPNFIHFLNNFHIPKDNYVLYRKFDQVRGAIEKITLAFQSQAHMKMYGRKLSKYYSISYHRNCYTFDIGKPHINKGVGASVIADYYHIPVDAIYAFGDGDNDVELLSYAGYGIAMEKHDVQLDKVANMVTASVKDEGIYKALQKLEVM